MQRKILLQVLLYFFGSMGRGRVLNEHNTLGIIVLSNPGHHNICQYLQLLLCVDLQSSFNEMRGHHTSVTGYGTKHHRGGWVLALHHWRHFTWVPGDYPRISSVSNLINHEFLFINKDPDITSMVLSDSTVWNFFDGGLQWFSRSGCFFAFWCKTSCQDQIG